MAIHRHDTMEPAPQVAFSKLNIKLSWRLLANHIVIPCLHVKETAYFTYLYSLLSKMKPLMTQFLSAAENDLASFMFIALSFSGRG